jgi:restriction system protein
LTPRKRKHQMQFPVQAAFVAGALALCVWVLQHEFGVVLLLALAILAAVISIKFVLPARHNRNILAKTDAMITQHADQLGRRRAQLVRQDAYGKPIMDKWYAEIEHFALQHIRPSFAAMEQSHFDTRRAEYIPLVATRIEQLVPQRPAFDGFTESMNPSEFETFCAEQLQKTGWNARVTQTSRDQGVDVVAEKGPIRVVLQCKLYSNPVGNKAVQEVVAGRAHEQANYGAVVTNSTYTNPAQELASTNGILLLHHSDLPQLEALLRKVPSAASLSQSATIGK